MFFENNNCLLYLTESTNPVSGQLDPNSSDLKKAYDILGVPMPITPSRPGILPSLLSGTGVQAQSGAGRQPKPTSEDMKRAYEALGLTMPTTVPSHSGISASQAFGLGVHMAYPGMQAQAVLGRQPEPISKDMKRVYEALGIPVQNKQGILQMKNDSINLMNGRKRLIFCVKC